VLAFSVPVDFDESSRYLGFDPARTAADAQAQQYCIEMGALINAEFRVFAVSRTFVMPWQPHWYSPEDLASETELQRLSGIEDLH
jgi:hypothetical protein